jgi:hypothetical protein
MPQTPSLPLPLPTCMPAIRYSACRLAPTCVLSTLSLCRSLCIRTHALPVPAMVSAGDYTHPSPLSPVSLHTHTALPMRCHGHSVPPPPVHAPRSRLTLHTPVPIRIHPSRPWTPHLNGVTKTESPGSLWSPADTASFGIDNWNHLGSLLFMAGFSGHTVILSLARGVTDPNEFNTTINWAFVRLYHMPVFSESEVGFFRSLLRLSTRLSGAQGILCSGSLSARRCGYLHSLDPLSLPAPFCVQISMELVHTPGYNAALNQAALWMLVVGPLCVASLPCLLPISANSGAGPIRADHP